MMTNPRIVNALGEVIATLSSIAHDDASNAYTANIHFVTYPKSCWKR